LDDLVEHLSRPDFYRVEGPGAHLPALFSHGLRVVWPNSAVESRPNPNFLPISWTSLIRYDRTYPTAPNPPP
jgi:hypothetical protein